MKASKNLKQLISAGELSIRTGESYDTINHWTRIGLLTPRRQGRKRLYELEEVGKCKRIRELQGEGHNLLTIHKTLEADGIL